MTDSKAERPSCSRAGFPCLGLSPQDQQVDPKPALDHPTCVKPLQASGADSGFSLLEMTVALFLGAMLLTLVAESGVTMLDRWQLSLAERNIRNQVSALPLKAHASRRAFTFDEAIGSDIILPEGWTISAEDEIFYADTGICSGGVVEIRSPNDRVWRYSMEAPFCRAM